MEYAEDMLLEAIEDIVGHLEQAPRLDDVPEVLEELEYLQATEDIVSMGMISDAVRTGVRLWKQHMQDDAEV